MSAVLVHRIQMKREEWITVEIPLPENLGSEGVAIAQSAAQGIAVEYGSSSRYVVADQTTPWERAGYSTYVRADE